MTPEPTEDRTPDHRRNALPISLSRYSIPGAIPHYLKFENGYALLQELKGYDFNIWHHRIQTVCDLNLPLVNIPEHFSILYVQEGTFQFTGEHKDTDLLKTDEMILSYTKGHPLQVHLTPGTHVLIQLAYTEHFMQPYIAHSNILKEIIQNPQKEAFSSSLQPVPIPRSAKQIIETWLNDHSQHQIHRVALVKNLADELLKGFILKLENPYHDHTNYLIYQIVMKIADYIKENPEEKISVPELAKKFNYHHSVSRLGSDFKNLFNMSIQDFQFRERINLAKKLMQQRKGNFIYIAYQCGFYDSAHFSRIFKRFTGMTPREYLRSLKSGE